MDWALWLKAFHIIALTAWMVSMWYLPRLLVYHSDAAVGSPVSEQFKVMERRLLKAIANPAMLATLLLGATLATVQGQWGDGWLHGKLALVALMLACHGVLAKHVRLMAAEQRPRPARWYRVVNEVPTVLFAGIVVLVVVKPL